MALTYLRNGESAVHEVLRPAVSIASFYPSSMTCGVSQRRRTLPSHRVCTGRGRKDGSALCGAARDRHVPQASCALRLLHRSGPALDRGRRAWLRAFFRRSLRGDVYRWAQGGLPWQCGLRPLHLVLRQQGPRSDNGLRRRRCFVRPRRAWGCAGVRWGHEDPEALGPVAADGDGALRRRAPLHPPQPRRVRRCWLCAAGLADGADAGALADEGPGGDPLDVAGVRLRALFDLPEGAALQRTPVPAVRLRAKHRARQDCGSGAHAGPDRRRAQQLRCSHDAEPGGPPFCSDGAQAARGGSDAPCWARAGALLGPSWSVGTGSTRLPKRRRRRWPGATCTRSPWRS